MVCNAIALSHSKGGYKQQHADLKRTVLSERSQSQKNKYSVIPFLLNSREDKTIVIFFLKENFSYCQVPQMAGKD